VNQIQIDLVQDEPSQTDGNRLSLSQSNDLSQSKTDALSVSGLRKGVDEAQDSASQHILIT